MVITNASLSIDEVMGGPIIVFESAPQVVIVVQRDRITDAKLVYCPGDVGGFALERELRRVNSDYHEAILAVPLVPGFDVRDRAQAVDAAVGPEIDHHDLALQLLARQRATVDPRTEPREAGK